MILQPAIGVCGFGRCGTSAVMAMLDAGGIQPVAGSQPVSYELPSIESIATLQVDELAGRAVKLLDAVAYVPLPLPHPGFWRFVWLDRDSRQQARSQVKMLAAFAGLDPEVVDLDVLAAGMRLERPVRLGHLRSIAEPGGVLVLSYEQLLANPRRAARHLAKFAPDGVTFDVDAATAVVHDRDADCRPDLSVEGLEPAAAGDPIGQLQRIASEADDRYARESRAELLRECGGDLVEYRRRLEALGLDLDAPTSEVADG